MNSTRCTLRLLAGVRMNNIGLNCDVCNTRKKYFLDWDAYYCPQCNEWKEKKCDDPHCLMCKIRPEKPRNENH